MFEPPKQIQDLNNEKKRKQRNGLKISTTWVMDLIVYFWQPDSKLSRRFSVTSIVAFNMGHCASSTQIHCIRAPSSRLSGWLALLTLIMASVACWSSDTLFIPPTATSPPTAVPPTQSAIGLYAVGDSVVITGTGVASVYLTEQPEPVTRRNRVPNAACYPNTTVVIRAVEQVDGVIYYQVECNNTPGWVAEEMVRLP
jgi:hypothetical protein